MAIFVMLRKWFDFLIALCDISAWTIVQCGKKPHSGGERSETTAVKATSVARSIEKGGAETRTNERNSPRAGREERAELRRVWSERETRFRGGKGEYKAHLWRGGG